MTVSKLISFEGIDGSGKTTVIKAVKEKLEHEGYRVALLHEPGGTLVGDAIRDLLKSDIPCTSLGQLLLFLSSRANLSETILSPARHLYDFILIDRFTDSTIAYQAYGNGLDRQMVEALNRLSVNGNMPDHTIFIDVDSDVAAKRRQARNDIADKFDTDPEYAQRVIDGYQTIIAEEPNRFSIIRNDILDETVEEVYQCLCREYKHKGHRRTNLAKQSKNTKQESTYYARVARPGKDKDGKPTLLLTHIKRKQDDQTCVADHVWVDYTRELVKAGTLVKGDQIAFSATITHYNHARRDGRASFQEYGLSNLTNVRRVYSVTIPKNEDNFARRSLDNIYAITDDDIFIKVLSKYTGFVSAMNHKLWPDFSDITS